MPANHRLSHISRRPKRRPSPAMLMLLLIACVASCAKMGNPDGGWFDETPPRVIGSSPQDKGTNVTANKINIYFNEYIKLDNPTEKVVISPPQLEQPEIKGAGKRIQVELKDSLRPNITYTIDFSDAISDNNEGNPLGNFTYSFSTGDEIDTMEVAGHVLNAENLEPVKGILVGLYSNLADSAFQTEPMLRVSRTDSRGRFVIKGVAAGQYRVFALQDADNNYFFSQKSEMLAFSHDIVEPSWKPDVRQDTIWRDSLRIDSIARVHYTHFLPDDLVLHAFTETQTDRQFLKFDRKEADHFTLFFTYGDSLLPEIEGLNFKADDAFVVETNLRQDTINYWLRDTMLVNQDTLQMALTYRVTDTLGVLQTQTDTVEILAKTPYEKRMKDLQKEREKWQKKQDKAKKNNLPYDSIYPVKMLEPKYGLSGQLDPDAHTYFNMPCPLARCDTSKVHLYVKRDTLWYEAAHELKPVDGSHQRYEFRAEWRPGGEYSLEVDSAAFEDLYGLVNKPFKQGIKVKTEDEYSSLFVTINGLTGKHIVTQLLDKTDKMVKQVATDGQTAEFYFITPGEYYLRCFEDDNRNGLWDTGNYADDLQPERVYYYHEKIECKAKWDVSRQWNPLSRNAALQKPSEIVQQKADKEKTIKHQNAERAKKLGIQYLEKISK